MLTNTQPFFVFYI